MPYHCYILYSQAIDKYYVGSTADLEARIAHHNAGDSKWTKRGIPWEIVHSESFSTRGEALKREKFIKRQKSRIFIQQLVEQSR